MKMVLVALAIVLLWLAVVWHLSTPVGRAQRGGERPAGDTPAGAVAGPMAEATGRAWPIPPARPVAARASRSQHREPLSRLDLLDWHALAQCESSDNPRAVNGPYRGLYQMDQDFWETYGGLTFGRRPDLATRAQQRLIAQRGYLARGREPWPTCGSRL